MALSAKRFYELRAVSRWVFARLPAPPATDGVACRLPRFDGVVALLNALDNSERHRL